ncbi:unnamed protein product [Paramecium primaurelia]|uniref:Uncharacterized protein n=1 Tax=Paramecium primaurelia TaxID=5886 RepID=A0A8S1P9V4_PARPR|nr:unnamed protein product [Paramecium primaurelia]
MTSLLIHKMNSGKQGDDAWYFDCPAFDDKISENTSIGYRINFQIIYERQTVIGLLVNEGHIRDAQVIKDTFKPLYELIKEL